MMGTSLIPSAALSYLFFWGLIRCVLFFALVIVLFRTRVVYTARKRDGTFRDKMGRESMSKHILVSLPIGLVLGVFLTIIPSTASYFLWVK